MSAARTLAGACLIPYGKTMTVHVVVGSFGSERGPGHCMIALTSVGPDSRVGDPEQHKCNGHGPEPVAVLACHDGSSKKTMKWVCVRVGSM